GNSRADSADAVAAADKAPATQPAAAVGLPAGHPPIPSAQKNGELPAGHPPIPGSRGRELPAGHPPVPGTAGKTGELPAGHPEISQKQAADSGQPIMGTVKIHAM